MPRRTKHRLPDLPDLPQSVSFPGISALVSILLELFSGTILQADGTLQASTILGVP